ncbi:MAG TPA: carboxypeptidase regulatory-like domain-containing protein [Vicinamibacterales bacterium]|nr:carboxypeptidase regulatory-like domain-containing protein [Vicinamibacterales bacterium]
MMRRLAIAILALLLFPPGAAAQGQSSAVQGHVVDDSGSAMPGVTVVVTHQGSGVFRQVVSNDDGSYFVTGILPGPYRITAELSGFRKYERSDVLLTVGNTATIDITLGIGALEESVTVTGEAPLVDITSKQIGANIGQAELGALPIMNKDWMYAVGLTPGIQVASSTASFSCESLIVGGGSNRSGNFSIDGGGNNDDYLGSSCGSQVRPAIEAVQEFQVLTNQYDAEFGRTAGAVVNVVTKQGTNNFHGSLFDSYTGTSLAAKDFFVEQRGLAKPQTAQKDWGGTLGGPVIKNKAHFFYSLDRIIYDEGRSAVFPASRSELNYANTQSMHLINHMARFDHQINPNNTWTFRYLVEYSPTYKRLARNETPAGLDQEFDIDRTTGGKWNWVLGNTRVNELRVGYTHEKNGFTAPEIQDGIPAVNLAPTLQMLGTWFDGPNNGAQFRIDNAYEVSEAYSWFLPKFAGGNNDLKFGGQYIYTTIELPDQTDMNGRFSFSTDKSFNRNDPSTYPERLFIRGPDPSDILMPTDVAVFFVQDKWRRNNVTLNLGVRYDLEVTPITNGFNPLFAQGAHSVDRNNFAPRLGVTWTPGGSNKNVVRGGYGIFYDKVTLQTTTPFVSQAVYSSSFVAAFPTNAVDPGPSRGQLPTDPMLVNGPVVNRSLLDTLVPHGSLGRNTGIVFVDNPDRVVPNTHQISVGYERQLSSYMAATVDYIHSWNRDQLITFDLNPGLRADTTRSGRISYTDLDGIASTLGISPFANQVLTRTNAGSSQFDGLNVSVEKRYSHNWAARISYAAGYARGNAEADQTHQNNYQLLNDPRLDQNFGPLNADRRQNLVISGRVEIPGTRGLTISGASRFMTGTPMTLINSGIDADRNGLLFDRLPAGTYCGQGLNSICVDFDGRRNGARGPNFKQTDLKFSYRFRPLRQTLETSMELYNLFNVANFSNPGAIANGGSIVDQRLSDFLVLNALSGGNGQPRALQFSVRFAF